MDSFNFQELFADTPSPPPDASAQIPRFEHIETASQPLHTSPAPAIPTQDVDDQIPESAAPPLTSTSTSFLAPSSVLLSIAALLVCYWLAQMFNTFRVRWQEEKSALEQRRRHGIPDDDKRPFSVAFTDAVRQRSLAVSSKASSQPRDTQPQHEGDDEESRSGLRRRIAADAGSMHLPRTASTPHLATGFGTAPSYPQSRVPSGAQSYFAINDPYAHAVPAQTLPSIPEQWTDRYNPPHVASAPNPSSHQPTTRPYKRLLDRGARSSNAVPTSSLARGNRKRLNLRGPGAQYEEEAEYIRTKRGRRDNWGHDEFIDGDAQPQWALPHDELDSPRRKARRDHEKANRPPALPTKDVEPTAGAGADEANDMVIDSSNAARGVKRDRDDAASAFGDDDKYAVKKPLRKRGRGEALPALSKDPLCEGRRIGDEWTSGEFRFKVGEDGKRRIQATIREKRSRFAMPADSHHHDVSSMIMVWTDKWLTDEEYSEAKANRMLSWQAENQDEAGSVVAPSEVSEGGTHHKRVVSSHWDIIGQAPHSGLLKGGASDNGKSTAIPLKPGRGRILAIAALPKRSVSSVSTLASLGASTSRPRLTKWEKQKREQESLDALRLARAAAMSKKEDGEEKDKAVGPGLKEGSSRETGEEAKSAADKENALKLPSSTPVPLNLFAPSTASTPAATTSSPFAFLPPKAPATTTPASTPGFFSLVPPASEPKPDTPAAPINFGGFAPKTSEAEKVGTAPVVSAETPASKPSPFSFDLPKTSAAAPAASTTPASGLATPASTPTFGLGPPPVNGNGTTPSTTTPAQTPQAPFTFGQATVNGSSQPAQPSAFGSSAAPVNAFAAPQPSAPKSMFPFGSSTPATNGTASPFGMPSGDATPKASTINMFGSTQASTTPAGSPFGAQAPALNGQGNANGGLPKDSLLSQPVNNGAFGGSNGFSGFTAKPQATNGGTTNGSTAPSVFGSSAGANGDATRTTSPFPFGQPGATANGDASKPSPFNFNAPKPSTTMIPAPVFGNGNSNGNGNGIGVFGAAKRGAETQAGPPASHAPPAPGSFAARSISGGDALPPPTPTDSGSQSPSWPTATPIFSLGSPSATPQPATGPPRRPRPRR
ncbi:hypothetical protein BOTBODRAFT_59451 [Botryobasidium botryosum FD-172 SS1]|uniref:Uncharacterized protein n=1 Tax=Botryobasidium botryosum (strain FD-172 SS1) TaxID=930990 RepID=A0A067M0P5_BOTB1|nr:hypothetical protein BOTBODRAFT_59451 [Botryobasidium botryosum FD-172 SS1]